jgi:hypothetical protein
MLGGVRVCVLVPLLDLGLLQLCKNRRGRSRRSGGSRKTSGYTDSEIPHRAPKHRGRIRSVALAERSEN